MTDVRGLADELFALMLEASPTWATKLGIPGYDDRMPDLSLEAADRFASELRRISATATAAEPAEAADRVTRAAVLNTADGWLAELDSRPVEHTVSVMGNGPSMLFAVAGTTSLVSGQQAADHLQRTAAYADYLDAHLSRLQRGASEGRFPVTTLVQVALAQVDGYLGRTDVDALADVAPPQGWDGAAGWREAMRAVVRDRVRPAMQRWRDGVAALPTRPDEACGLAHLPGGPSDYDALTHRHTTLPLAAQEVHDIGRAAVADLVERMTDLGATLGLVGFPAVRDAVKASGLEVPAEQAMAQVREAVRRAEAAVVGVFPEPLPPPCEVAAMSEHLGRAGMPPHYTPPKPDGSALGTYWFNAEVPGAGSGWDLEAVAFHEAVPGHHLQLSRSHQLVDVPLLQAKGVVTAHAEGWGLYAEVLAGELGLYSSVQAELGSLAVQLFRAARLVVDTGIHLLGWPREEAVRWFGETVPLPQSFIESEVNRYIGIPGQALAYMIGQREVLRLRAGARERLGPRFDLAGFHSAVLDSGLIPLPAVAAAVDTWADALAGS